MMKRLIALLLITTLLLPSFSFAKEDKSRRRRHQELDDKSIKETESETESTGTGLLVGGGLLFFSGMMVTVISLTLKSESEKPITVKYKEIYYYGYYYDVVDTDAYLREVKDRQDKKDKSDTFYPIGISLLGIGIVLIIVGGTMSDIKKQSISNNFQTTKNYHISLNYQKDTPSLMLNYRF